MDTSLVDVFPLEGDLNSTFGVLLIGFMFASLFYGCTFFQTYVFFTRYPNETWFIKGAIGLLCAADTSVTVLMSHAVYNYLINNFNVSFHDLDVIQTFTTVLAVIKGEVLLVQFFYAFRIWILGARHPILPALICSTALSSFALAIVTAVQMSNQPLLAHIINHNIELFAGLSAGLGTLCSILIVVAQYYYLQPGRQPGMKIQKGIFDITILHVLSRGTLFTLMQLVLLLTYVVIPHDYVWICFHFVIGRIYTNSLLAMLNSRSPFRGRGLNEEEGLNSRNRSVGESLTAPGGRSTQRKYSISNPGGISVKVSSKGERSIAMELDVMESRSGDEAQKSAFDTDEAFDTSSHELTAEKKMSIIESEGSTL